jgi:hypothetical protein
MFDRFNWLDKTVRVRWGAIFQPFCVLLRHDFYLTDRSRTDHTAWLCKRCGKWENASPIVQRGLEFEIGPSTWPTHEAEAPDTGSGEPKRESPNGGSFSLRDEEPWHPSRGPQ